MKGFLLFIIAFVLLLPLTVVNFLVVFFDKETRVRGYFLSTAINIDKFANREFRAMLNKFLRTKNGYEFGNFNETISSALGKNKRDGTLSGCGKLLACLLDFLDENHCEKAIS